MLTLLPQFEVQLELFPGFWSQSLSSLQSLFLADHHLINDNDDHDDDDDDMTQCRILGKFEYTGGPIFKVVLEC